MRQSEDLRVFPISKTGGNPTRIMLDAQDMSRADMIAVTKTFGHECGFVFPAEAIGAANYRFRYFVPGHEMEMCGHATIGALWAMRDRGLLRSSDLIIDTLSGLVKANVPASGSIAISQPRAKITLLTDAQVEAVRHVLGIGRGDLLR